MNYEPLKHKKHHIIKQAKSSKNKDTQYYQGFEQGVDDSFELFASYVDLYKKYQNDVKLLMKEQQPVWKQWVKFYEKKNNVTKDDYLPLYNNWLFDHIFNDVNNTKTDDFLNL